MRLYISGPMTGIPGDNRGTFEAARTRLRAMGHFVVCPAELDAIQNDGSETSHAKYLSLLVRDVAMLFTCGLDGVVLLEGWSRSRGARMEILAAMIAKARLFRLTTDMRELVPVQVDAIRVDDLVHPKTWNTVPRGEEA